MTTAIVDSLQSNERNLEAKLDQIMAEISRFKHDLTVQLNEIKSQFETRLEKEIQNAKRQAKQLIFDEIMSHKSQIIKNDLSHDKTMRKEIVRQVTEMQENIMKDVQSQIKEIVTTINGSVSSALASCQAGIDQEFEKLNTRVNAMDNNAIELENYSSMIGQTFGGPNYPVTGRPKKAQGITPHNYRIDKEYKGLAHSNNQLSTIIRRQQHCF